MSYPTAYGCIAKRLHKNKRDGPEVIFSIITSSKEAAIERCKKYEQWHPKEEVWVMELDKSIYEDESMADYFEQ